MSRRDPRWLGLVVAVAVAVASCSPANDTVAPPTTGASLTAPSTTTASADDSSTNDTGAGTTDASTENVTTTTTPVVAVERGIDRLVASGFDAIDGRRVGLITNQVSVVGGRHLIDWMAEADNVDLVRIFAAEHGVRGVAGAGEPIGDGIDDTTGVAIRSLYGSTRQPTPEMLDGIDTIVFDLQDVGTRYYTYTATMGLAMQAAADADISFVVLDRPNPLGRLVEGDLRTDSQNSFISQYPVPSIHGLTAGELALMIVGEALLPGLDGLDLEIVEMTGWSGRPWLSDEWALSDPDIANEFTRGWIPPSPGLRSASSAATYPATVWFEATTLSYGAGTDLAFRAVGAPWLDADAVADDLNRRSLPGVEFRAVELAPVDIVDVAIDPRFEGEVIPGVEVIITDPDQFRPSATGLHMVDAVTVSAPDQTVIDRGAVFDLLAGTAEVRRALRSGMPVADITGGWDDVAAEFEARSFAYQLY